MPNFYNKAIIESNKLKSLVPTLYIQSLDHFLARAPVVRMLQRLGFTASHNLTNPIVLLSIILARNEFAKIVFIGPIGIILTFLLRKFGCSQKSSVILYDVSFITNNTPSQGLIRLVNVALTHALQTCFTGSSEGQLLVLCTQHLELLKASHLKLNVHKFDYGVYTPFYDQQRRLRSEMSQPTLSIHPTVLPFKYCLAIGSAYRDESSLKAIAAKFVDKNQIILRISIDHSMPFKSIIQVTSNLFYLFNFPPNDYLDLLFCSASALILSARPSSMAGLTTLLECVAMKKRIFVPPLCYLQDYLDHVYVNPILGDLFPDCLFDHPDSTLDANSSLKKSQSYESFLSKAQTFLHLL